MPIPVVDGSYATEPAAFPAPFFAQCWPPSSAYVLPRVLTNPPVNFEPQPAHAVIFRVQGIPPEQAAATVCRSVNQRGSLQELCPRALGSLGRPCAKRTAREELPATQRAKRGSMPSRITQYPSQPFGCPHRHASLVTFGKANCVDGAGRQGRTQSAAGDERGRSCDNSRKPPRKHPGNNKRAICVTQPTSKSSPVVLHGIRQPD